MTMPPSGSSFPKRNRLISSLALGIVIIERLNVITARSAAEQGREVFVAFGEIEPDMARRVV